MVLPKRLTEVLGQKFDHPLIIALVGQRCKTQKARGGKPWRASRGMLKHPATCEPGARSEALVADLWTRRGSPKVGTFPAVLRLPKGQTQRPVSNNHATSRGHPTACILEAATQFQDVTIAWSLGKHARAPCQPPMRRFSCHAPSRRWRRR